MKIKLFFIALCCVLLAGCSTWLEPMNEYYLRASGQFYAMENGEKVPFCHKVKYDVQYQKDGFAVSHFFIYAGVTTGPETQTFYSDEDGHFSFKLNRVASEKVTIFSSCVVHDTLKYKTSNTFELKNCIKVSGLEIVFTKKPVYQDPDQAKFCSKYSFYKGDKHYFKIKNADDVKYSYNDTRNPVEPVFNLSQFAGDTTTIYALNVGVDTFYVEYMTQAESPQPQRAPIVIEVKEWTK